MHVPLKGLAFAIYYPFLAVIGVPANLAVIVILHRRSCGLSRCIGYYVVSMATTDLLVIITSVVLGRIAGIYFPLSFLSITPICSVHIAIIYATIDSSAWLTVAFTFDRFVAICCQKLKINYCTGKTALWVIGAVCALSSLKSVLQYFIFEPMYVINDVPWFCVTKAAFYTSPAWNIYDWLRSISMPCAPFVLILLFNALTVRHILAANSSRRRLRAQNNGDNQRDPEMEKRRRSIVLLFAISCSFILLYSIFFATILYVRIAKVPYFSVPDISDSSFILEESGYMLQLLSSCINPFIYAGTQSKFRAELKKMGGVFHSAKLLSCSSFQKGRIEH